VISSAYARSFIERGSCSRVSETWRPPTSKGCQRDFWRFLAQLRFSPGLEDPIRLRPIERICGTRGGGTDQLTPSTRAPTAAREIYGGAIGHVIFLKPAALKSHTRATPTRHVRSLARYSFSGCCSQGQIMDPHSPICSDLRTASRVAVQMIHKTCTSPSTVLFMITKYAKYP
jgi:hypothetical protein